MILGQATISPRNEAIAYEALSSIRENTLKKLAPRLMNGRRLPSELLSEEQIIDDLTQKAKEVLESVSVDFSISMFGDLKYPHTLRDVKHPLPLFYFRGDLALLEKRCISVVGAREVSPEGIARAERLARLLAEKDFVVVSGLARGVDTAAMTSAIRSGGNVVGVIGTPIDSFYPKENKKLQEYVATHNLLISQVPFLRYSMQDYRINRFYFPERNETMSALSEATIIVEASDKSGTLTQARAALKQGRKLFILNSCFENPRITWPAKYEKRGAIRVKSVDEIVERLAEDDSEPFSLESEWTVDQD
ncbi:DNA-processing protein DprA [Rubellicoccus peritrichatus]|uniref:DNA-processing protein DprA n=1 Tax=Rubellicoccus peritrichatus TaxID=3080537 RepID=A0AAQ3LBP2_9BACT|nr:DNA-processing protein DprA [Puniceicoccus sp. CR14]WOO43124.1 DNA-processing protein DprA [Puniceicoccus sp. CR14]